MTPLRLLMEPLTRSELATVAQAGFGDMVKAVVDISRGIMAIGGDLHSDEEALLLDHGSEQKDLWGINLYPEQSGDEMVEFDSMINVRPSQGNRSREVENDTTREAIRAIVARLIIEP